MARPLFWVSGQTMKFKSWWCQRFFYRLSFHNRDSLQFKGVLSAATCLAYSHECDINFLIWLTRKKINEVFPERSTYSDWSDWLCIKIFRIKENEHLKPPPTLILFQMVAKPNLIVYMLQKAIIHLIDSLDGLCTQHDASCCRVLGWGLRWGFNRGGGCLGPDPCWCCSLLEESLSSDV